MDKKKETNSYMAKPGTPKHVEEHTGKIEKTISNLRLYKFTLGGYSQPLFDMTWAAKIETTVISILAAPDILARTPKKIIRVIKWVSKMDQRPYILSPTSRLLR